MDTERQKENGMSDYNRFFENSWERFIEIVSDVKEVAASEDIKAIRERVEDLKEMSDGFKNIDPNELSDNERKACEHFTGALDRLSGLCSYTSDCFRSGPGKDAVKKYLKLMFMIPKGISAVARDLTAAKEYMDKDILLGEMTK